MLQKCLTRTVDEECYEMLEQLVEQMKENQGVTEQLKEEKQMLWLGKMNNIIACAEEIVVREVVSKSIHKYRDVS